MRSLSRLRADTRGAAAVEFGLITTSLFFIFLAVFDFGGLLLQEHRLGQAVSAAANDAFQNRTSVNFSNIPAYVRNGSGQSAATVTATCNGSTGTACTNSSRTCACLSSSGAYSTATCGSTCSGSGFSSGQTAGYFLTIRTTNSYSGVIVPTGLLRNGTVSRSLTIRLQ